jgi:zinc transporter 5/7
VIANPPLPSAFAKSLLSAHGGGHSVNGTPSPITPSYSFVHDEHYERAHAAESGPNLHAHGHGHGGHGHEGHSDNMRGVFLHVLAVCSCILSLTEHDADDVQDTMGSVGVIISTLLIKLYGWTGFDPIASLFIAILIIASVVPLVLDTGRILALDVSSRRSQIDDALAEVAAIQGVAKYEVPRFWPKDGSSYIGSIRIKLARAPGSVDVGGPHGTVTPSYFAIDRVAERVDSVLKAKIRGLEEMTIEVDGE